MVVFFSPVMFMTTVTSADIGTELDLTRVGVLPGVNEEVREDKRVKGA